MNSYKPTSRFSIPPIVKNLIIINALCWLASITLPSLLGIDIVDLFGLHYWSSEKFNPIQLITYMFLHDTTSISHLFFNMFGLWMFGKDIETFWGGKRFLIYYLITGIGAGIIQELTWMISFEPMVEAFNTYISTRDISVLQHFFPTMHAGTTLSVGQALALKGQVLNQAVTVGASGSIFGILLAFGMLFPQARIFLLFFPVPIRAPYFVAIYALAELFMGVSNSAGDNVAHFAHLGGMIFGIILILFWRKKGEIY